VGRITVSADFDAPPAAVWSVLEPVERHVDWMADAESIRFLDDQTRGVGTRFECVTVVGPIRLADVMEITEWQPERRMGVRHDGVVTGPAASRSNRSTADGGPGSRGPRT
jgi:hypothetical protein